MNQAVKLVLLYIRDLLNYDEQLMKPGRINEEQENFSTNYIAVDTLGPSTKLSSLVDFNGDAELLKIGGKWASTMTISFYGKDAYDNADNFLILQSSQNALEIKESLGFDGFASPSYVDVKLLTGQQYRNRLDISMVCVYNKVKDITTRRIDTQQFDVITNN